MKIIAADDEALALDLLTESIQEALPDADIVTFQKPSKIMSYIEENTCDIAFLDINMRGTTGLELAKKLTANNPNMNIIFVTGFDEYAMDAMKMHTSGYITKPVTVKKIQEELNALRHPVADTPKKRLIAKCFGNFEVYTMDGHVIHFDRSKGKEVLAYLIYRAGASCTIKEIAAALFEDTEYDKNQRGYIQKIVYSLISTLKKENAEEVIIKNFNSLAINTSLIDCDYYKFTENDSTAINSYCGEFMAQYSWAEFVTGYLEEQFWKKSS